MQSKSINNEKKIKTNFQIFSFIWHHINKRRKSQIILTFILMFLAAISELISIGSTIPFISAILNPELLLQNKNFSQIFTFFSVSNPFILVKFITIFFCLAALFSGIIKILLTYVQLKLGASIAIDFSTKLYNNYLNRNYSFHSLNNSSILLSKISKSGELGTWFITPILVIFSSSIMLLIVTFSLFVVSPKTVLSVFLVFGLVYFLLAFLTKNILKTSSKKLDLEYDKMFKTIQEGFGGIRNIIIDSTQNLFTKIYSNSAIPYRKAWITINFTNQSPKFIVETIGMMLIAFISTFFIYSQEFKSSIVVLGVLAISAQRLLPLMQMIFGSLATIRGNKESILNIITDLDKDVNVSSIIKLDDVEVLFNEKILVKGISYQYPNNKNPVLENINLTIIKGERIGIVGKTGSGKSTLIDIIMQLLVPQEGNFYVDTTLITDRNRHVWQKTISHVPQNIFLSDATVMENIAFGVEKSHINFSKIVKAAKLANIDNDIQMWSLKYDTIIGERGVRLSGGQRQRIGIARAFYKEANIVIFDEATSALDNNTEHEIMKSIDTIQKSLTVLIIAHRITTLKKCDRIIEVINSKIYIYNSYDEYVNIIENRG